MPFGSTCTQLALLLLTAAHAATAAPCASYLHKPDWNIGAPIEADRCTGRFMTLPPAERACTGACLPLKQSRFNRDQVFTGVVFFTPRQ